VRSATVWGWTAAIFLVPFAAPAAYLLTGNGALPRSLRYAAVGGGVAIYALVLLIGAGAGGIS